MTTTPAPDDGDPDAPVVGRRRHAAPRVSMTLCSYDAQERETLHRLTARATLDTGTLFGFSSSDDDSQRIVVMQNFLLRALVDDDGVSTTAVPEQVRPAGKKTGAELVPVGDAELTLAERQDVVWRLDGVDETFPSSSLATQYATANGSSLRRFAALVDDPWATVDLEALEEMIERITTAATDRPTERSADSPRSRQTAGR